MTTWLLPSLWRKSLTAQRFQTWSSWLMGSVSMFTKLCWKSGTQEQEMWKCQSVPLGYYDYVATRQHHKLSRRRTETVSRFSSLVTAHFFFALFLKNDFLTRAACFSILVFILVTCIFAFSGFAWSWVMKALAITALGFSEIHFVIVNYRNIRQTNLFLFIVQPSWQRTHWATFLCLMNLPHTPWNAALPIFKLHLLDSVSPSFLLMSRGSKDRPIVFLFSFYNHTCTQSICIPGSLLFCTVSRKEPDCLRRQP